MACCEASLANNTPRQGQRPVQTRVESDTHEKAVGTETCSSTARFEKQTWATSHKRTHTSPSTKRLTFFRNSMAVCTPARKATVCCAGSNLPNYVTRPHVMKVYCEDTVLSKVYW